MFSLDLCGCFFRPRVWPRALWWDDDLSSVYCCPETIIVVLPNQPDFLLPSTTLFPVNVSRAERSQRPQTHLLLAEVERWFCSKCRLQAIRRWVISSYPVRPLWSMASSPGGNRVCRYSRNMEPHIIAHYRHPKFLKLKSIADTIFGLSFLAVAEFVRFCPFVSSPCDWIRR